MVRLQKPFFHSLLKPRDANLYRYVNDDPTTNTDPDGTAIFLVNAVHQDICVDAWDKNANGCWVKRSCPLCFTFHPTSLSKYYWDSGVIRGTRTDIDSLGKIRWIPGHGSVGKIGRSGVAPSCDPTWKSSAADLFLRGRLCGLCGVDGRLVPGAWSCHLGVLPHAQSRSEKDKGVGSL